MKRLAPALLVLLCACAGGERLPAPDVDPAVAECQREAERDPEVRAQKEILAFGRTYLSVTEQKLRAARDRALRACFVRKGIQPRGGVEAPLPYR